MSCNRTQNRTNEPIFRGFTGSQINFMSGVSVNTGRGEKGTIQVSQMVEGSINMTLGQGVLEVLDPGSQENTVRVSMDIPGPSEFTEIDDLIETAQEEVPGIEGFAFMRGEASARFWAEDSFSDIGTISRELPLQATFNAPLLPDQTIGGQERVEWETEVIFTPVKLPDFPQVKERLDDMGTVTFNAQVEPTSYTRNLISGATGERLSTSVEIPIECFIHFQSPGFDFDPGPKDPIGGGCIEDYPSIDRRISDIRQAMEDMGFVVPTDPSEIGQNIPDSPQGAIQGAGDAFQGAQGQVAGVVASPPIDPSSADISEAQDLIREARDLKDGLVGQDIEPSCAQQFISEIEGLLDALRSLLSDLDCSNVSSALKAEIEDAQNEVRAVREISPLDRTESRIQDARSKAESALDQVNREVPDANPCKAQLRSQARNALSELERIRVFEEEDFECETRFPDADAIISDLEDQIGEVTSGIGEERLDELIELEEAATNVAQQVDEEECMREFVRRIRSADRELDSVISPARIAQETISEAEERRQGLLSGLTDLREETSAFIDRASGVDFFRADMPPQGSSGREPEQPGGEDEEMVGILPIDDPEYNRAPDFGGGDGNIIREEVETEDGRGLQVEMNVEEIINELGEGGEVTRESLSNFIPEDEIGDDESIDDLVEDVRRDVEPFL